MKNKALSDIRKKKKVFAYAADCGNIAKTCRHFGISRDTFYRWKKNYEAKGDEGLIDSKPFVQKILNSEHLRKLKRR